jgi:hypothetical protein
MNKTNSTPCKTGTSTLVRAKFGPGMLLQHEDLEQLNAYTRDLSRLMFGSLFGCGVICGLVVSTRMNCGKLEVQVGKGLALGCSGDPVYVPRNEAFPIDENCDPDIPSPLWVVLCGTVKCCAPRTAVCSPDDDDVHAECTREREGYEICVVRQRPECACGCDEAPDSYYIDDTDCKCVKPYYRDDPDRRTCYSDHYNGECLCTCDDCSDCDCKCILLAKLEKNADGEWDVDHRVRRFIRPVLMRDPQVEREVRRRRESDVVYAQQLKQQQAALTARQQQAAAAKKRAATKSLKAK